MFHENPNQNQQVAPANLYDNPSQEPAVDMLINLLQDPGLKHPDLGFTELEQGQHIVDEFIGMVVAQGDLETSAGVSTPMDRLNDVSAVFIAAKHDDEPFKKKLQYVSRAGGLRHSAALLESDPRTAQCMSGMASRVKVDYQTGKPALRTYQQLHGYLEMTGVLSSQRTGENHQVKTNELLDEVKSYTDASKTPRMGRWDTHHIMTPDTPDLLRRTQETYFRAELESKRAGVDMGIVIASAEAIRADNLEGRYAGKVLVGQQTEFAAVLQRSHQPNPYDAYLAE